MNAQQLKNSILQLAVQGKLVPQDPNDEPASALIERIRAEKERLIKEKKIKPDKNPSYIFRGSDNLPYEKVGKNEPVCIAEEVPFDIPDSWEWVRLGSFCDMYTGDSINENEKKLKFTNISNGRYYIGTKDVGFDHIINYDNGVKIPEEYTKYRIAPAQCVLLCIEGGSAGRKIAITNQRVCFGNKLCCFNPFSESNREFLYFYLQSPAFTSVFKDKITGIIGGVSINTLKELYVPLPSLQEQQRIVDKLKELEPYINDYDKAYEKIEKLNTDFPDLLKKSILQEAVQGKLVPQDPTEEPASVLMEQIRKEKEQLIKDKKIKKDKNESYIFRRDNSHYEKIGTEERCIDDEIPFDIPDSWEWTRLGTITEILRGKGPKYADNTDFRILNQKCVRWGNIDTSFCKTVDKQWFESISKECLTTQKDILINSTGEGTIGRSSAVTSDAINMPYDSHVLLIRPYKCLNKYIEIFINGIEGQAQINRSKGAKTTKQTELGVDKTKNLLIPLPPLNEQQRIVDKVNQLIPQISKL